jgi:hypothetical protein
MILEKAKSLLINRKPDIDPKNDIKANVRTPPRVQSSRVFSLPVSLSSPIIDPNKREIINFQNKDSPITNYLLIIVGSQFFIISFLKPL